MQYEAVKQAVFLERPNRFVAYVDLNGVKTVCHVKNTGRCRELLVPGATVYLEHGAGEHRKTQWDLIAVEKGKKLINMDAQAPNRVFAEFASRFEPAVLAVHPEVRIGESRLDFCMDLPHGLHYVEVKGVTLEEDGRTFFPDAPTERGIKHLHELIRLRREGHTATAFFVIQMEGVVSFSPNDRTHPGFGEALRLAAKEGVQIAAYCCRVAPDSLQIDRPVPIVL